MKTPFLICWMLFRNLLVGVMVTIGFPILLASYYVIASALGGHLDDESGDIVLALPFAGAAFLIAMFIVAVFLFPATCVADGSRIFLKMKPWTAFITGTIPILLVYLPFQLTAADGFSLKSYGFGSAFLVTLFLFYWCVCAALDFVRIIALRRIRGAEQGVADEPAAALNTKAK